MWLIHMSVTAWEIWQTAGVACNFIICAHTAKFNFNLQSSNSSLIFNLLLLSFSLYYFLLGFIERSHWSKLIGFQPRLMRYCSLTIQSVFVQLNSDLWTINLWHLEASAALPSFISLFHITSWWTIRWQRIPFIIIFWINLQFWRKCHLWRTLQKSFETWDYTFI